MSELARRSLLAVASHLIKSIAIEAASASVLVSITASAVSSAFRALSSDVSVSSGALGHALVAEDVAGVALADTVLGIGTSRASSNASSTDQVEA